MGSKLSSLLVQEKLVPVKALSDALALQAILGGALDTILLEKRLVSEAAVLAASCRSSGLPVATDAQFLPVAPALVEFVDLETAKKLGICPVMVDAKNLTLLACEGTDMFALDALGYDLEREIHAYVAAEFRVLNAQAELYGTPLEARFVRLLDRLGHFPPDVEARAPTPAARSADSNAACRAESQAAVTVLDPLAVVETCPDSKEPDAPKALDAAAGERGATQVEPQQRTSGEVASLPVPPPKAQEELPKVMVAQELTAPLPIAEDSHGKLPMPADPEDEEPTVVELEQDTTTVAPEQNPSAPEERKTALAPEHNPPASEERTRAPSPPNPENEAEVHATALAPPQSAHEFAASPAAQIRADSEPTRTQPPRGGPHRSTRKQALEPELERALESIRATQCRDDLLVALAKAVRLFDVEGVKVYVVKGNLLSGHMELGLTATPRKDIQHQPAVSLEVPTAIARAVDSGTIYLGPPPDTDATASVLATAGITQARGLILVPIVLRKKTVCLLIAYSRHHAIPSAVRGPLSELASEATLALAEIIVRQRAGAPSPGAQDAAPATAAQLTGTAPPTAAWQRDNAPTVQVLVHNDAAYSEAQAVDKAERDRAPTFQMTAHEDAVSTELARHDGQGEEPPPEDLQSDDEAPEKGTPQWDGTDEVIHDERSVDEPENVAGGAPGTAAPMRRVLPSASNYIGPPSDLIRLLRELERDEDTARLAEARIQRLGRAAIDSLIAWFPGRLTPTTRTPLQELPPAHMCSPIMRALIALGRPVLTSLSPLLGHPEVEVRFFATYLMADLAYPESVALLARQASDPHQDIRRVAIHVLRKFRELPIFPSVLADLRSELKHNDPRPRRRGTEALGALGDEGAVPLLIRVLQDSDPIVAHSAQVALVKITKQDFGNRAKDWDTWWNKNFHRQRIEWLIDGLVHADPVVRASAAADLEDITQQTFGYSHDLSRTDREVIRQRFMNWFNHNKVAK